MIYQFRQTATGAVQKLDPQKVGTELELIAKKNGDELKSEDIVRAAQSARSAMHSYFEWDDSKAAYQHRITQAEYLRRTIVCLITPDGNGAKPIEVRAFQKVQIDEDSEPAYVSAQIYRNSPDMVDQIIEGIMRRAAILMTEAKQYKKLLPLAEALAKALEKIEN